MPYFGQLISACLAGCKKRPRHSSKVANSIDSHDPALTDSPIILFDGVCNLCNASVQFVMDRERGRTFRFAALQSEAGQALLKRHKLPAGELSSVVLLEQGRGFTRSTAALRIARRLRFPWPLAYGLVLIPPLLRNWVYDLVARNRYRWFGKSESCRVPAPELHERFLS